MVKLCTDSLSQLQLQVLMRNLNFLKTFSICIRLISGYKIGAFFPLRKLDENTFGEILKYFPPYLI